MRLKILMIIAAVAGICSCSDDLRTDIAAPQGQRVVFMVEGGGPETRVSYGDAENKITADNFTKSFFEVGDEVGACLIDIATNGTMSVGALDNVRYRVAKQETATIISGVDYYNELKPQIPSDTLPDESRYVFYYPYKVDADITSFTHTVLADQSTSHAYETSDLLRARVSTRTKEEDESVWKSSVEVTNPKRVAVKMEHVMACIVVKVPKGLLSTTDDNITLLGLSLSQTGINLTGDLPTSPTFGTIPGTSSSTTGNVTMWHFIGGDADYHYYRAVIPAQSVTSGTEFMQATFEGETDVTKLKSPADITFEPGKYYLFTLKGKALSFGGASDNMINVMKEGGNISYEYE